MTAKTMAEVLHQEGAWCGNCEFEGWDSCKDCRDTCEGYARALSAAGFGLVADAKAEALREAAEHFKQRSDTLHNTMLEMTGLPDFTAEDITRYGAYSAEANGTATWLRTKAAALRTAS